MEIIDKVTAFLSSPLLDLILKGSLIYLGLLWFSMIVWVARDVINRSNSIIFQVLAILINIALPVFGLVLYLVVRPSKTLIEKYYEELEYNFLSEHAAEEESCPRCSEHIAADFLFCPSCEERIRTSCTSCKKNYLSKYLVCPYCGRKQKSLKTQADKKKKAAKKAKKTAAKH